MTAPTVEHILALARQLTPIDKLRLIGQLAPLAEAELTQTAPSVATADDPWAALEHLRRDFAELPRASGTLAGQLERDRQERQAMLEGQRDVQS